MGRRAGVIASLTVLAASACGAPGLSSTTSLDGVDDASPAARAEQATKVSLPASGTCLSGKRLGDSPEQMASAVEQFGLLAYQQMADDPQWGDVIECADTHALEVYGVAELPQAVTRQLTSYTDFLESTGPLARDLRSAAEHACALKIPVAARVTSTVGFGVDVVPLVSPTTGRFTWSAPPPAVWDAGGRSIACLFEQTEPGTITTRAVVSDALPADQRTCLDRGTFVSCTALHDVERIATLRVDRAVAAGALRGERAVDPAGMVVLGNKQWSALDSICQRYLVAATAETPTRLRGVTDTYPELYPDAEGHFDVICSAQSPFGTPPEQMILSRSSVYAR